MKSTILSQFDMTYLPVIALFIFLTVFVFVVWWSGREGSRNLYEKMEKLPLDPQQGVHHGKK
jgi:hypothetical protein